MFKHQTLLAVRDAMAATHGFPRLESHLARLREPGRRLRRPLLPPARRRRTAAQVTSRAT
ncbi:hypothetical protein [Nonomuraea fuscirosea]|uniref:hypothetical protein n=1 Tax=Nonomuraea fuscirosea TaxID=1291556 RepID=UPI003432AFF8